MTNEHNDLSINSYAITAQLAAGDLTFLADADRMVKDALVKLNYTNPEQRKKLPDITADELPSLFELNKIYNRARAVTNGVLAGGTLLPSVLDAANTVMKIKSWKNFPGETAEYSLELEKSRLSEHPEAYKQAQIKLAKIMLVPRNAATEALPSELRDLMLNARKVQMLAWAQMRVIISSSISDDEIRQIRSNHSTRDAMGIIIERVEERIKTRFPVRVMQHDHYRETLEQLSADENERPADELMRNSMKSMIENSNTVMQHLLAHMVARLRYGFSPKEALLKLINLDIPEIAAITQRVSHDNPFSDRSKPHPHFEHDFELFVRTVEGQCDEAVFGQDGSIRWSRVKRGRLGGCPTQNMIQFKGAASPLQDSLAGKARRTIKLLQKYAFEEFGARPQFSEPPTIAELFVSINLLALAKPDGPLREDSEFFNEVINPLVEKKFPGLSMDLGN